MSNRRRAIIGIAKSGGRLPSAYQEVEYLESTGDGQYIDTGVAGSNTISSKLGIISVDIDNTIFVCQKITWSFNQYGVQFYSGRMVTTFGSVPRYLNSAITGERYNVEILPSLSMVKINNIPYNQTFSIAYSDNICLFTYQPSVGNNKVKICSCSLSENDTIIRDFVPCYRKSDSKSGLYDLVNDMFYTNANTSASTDFTVGPNV